MLKSEELCRKEVINIRTAERIGFVDDVEIDLESGCISGLVVPKRRVFFLKREDCVIPWSSISVIGSEIILADFFETE